MKNPKELSTDLCVCPLVVNCSSGRVSRNLNNGAALRPFQDGGYIPRILFLDSSGRVEPSLTTPNGNPAYKYFYSNEAQLIGGMNNAMKHFAKPPQEELDDDAELEELPDTMVEDEQVEEFELHERLSDEL